MCGIFGSQKSKRFKDLYSVNRARGDFAFGCCLITRDRSTQYIGWQPGVANFDDEIFSEKNDYVYMLGHTQAPTSAQREFTPRTSHPFVVNDWAVAHNGVLSNFNYLKEKYIPEWDNPVDSSIIPYLLTIFENVDASEYICVQKMLEELQGTYSMWVYNTKTHNKYIARCGSTLFFNRLENEFSSTKCDGMEEVPDNSLFQITVEGITQIGGFNGNSPFFII
jgi:glucosamine 6-phosphate synthetase-like amidotransferase/phosphosugar isomerase protein